MCGLLTATHPALVKQHAPGERRARYGRWPPGPDHRGLGFTFVAERQNTIQRPNVIAAGESHAAYRLCHEGISQTLPDVKTPMQYALSLNAVKLDGAPWHEMCITVQPQRSLFMGMHVLVPGGKIMARSPKVQTWLGLIWQIWNRFELGPFKTSPTSKIDSQSFVISLWQYTSGSRWDIRNPSSAYVSFFIQMQKSGCTELCTDMSVRSNVKKWAPTGS